MWQLFDIVECSVRAMLLLYLCSDMVNWKKKWIKQGKYLFFLLFVIGGFWLGSSGLLDRLLYGEDMYVQKSSTSIIKTALMMLVSFLLLDFFFDGKKLVKGYLALLYETILEMAKFGVHGFWSLFFSTYSDWQINRMIEDAAALEKYMERMRLFGYIWNLVLMILYSAVMYFTIRAVLKYRKNIRHIDRQGILFLMLSPAVGMAFDVMLRCLFFTRKGNEYEFIYDNYSGMYVIIPVMTFLCLLSIVYSAKIYEELMRAEEEKNGMLFYKQQLSDMTEYVQDMERLYDGIRGMRHDMNNCIADMEQLFLAGTGGERRADAVRKTVGKQALITAEAGKYLYRMKSALDALTFHYSTGNPVTDVIINRKWQECENEGITLESDFIYPASLAVEAFDVGILLNNALDNAIEACRKCVREKSLHIRLHSYQKGRMFFIRIENDCDGSLLQYDKTLPEALQTTKEDERMHGIGLQNMRKVTERYFGTMSHDVHDDVFILTIMLQEKRSLSL